jgi:2-polyprenyl-6-methoxyphenol hydroxylase-like FAD-dependent oxidoreductase
MSNAPSSHKLERLIIGGGVGGLCAALALARRGHAVHLLEREAAFQEVGYGIQLGPNATRALDQLGVLDSLSAVGVRPSALLYMDALSGEGITSVDLGEQFVEHYGHPYLVVHRSDLQRTLLAACANDSLVSIETDREVQQVTDGGDDVSVICRDGTTYEAKLVVAADGLRSRVRSLYDDDDLRGEGFVAYRGTLPTSEVEQSSVLDAMVLWVGPGAHAVQYKVRAGDLYNQVAVFRSRRFAEGHAEWGTPEELDEHYARFCEPVRLAATQLIRTQRYPMFDRDPIDRWAYNRIALLGDAAHPMLPVLAQGGCQAIEDALALSEAVSEYREVSAALEAYERLRAPRAARVQLTARRFADVCHIDGVGVELRNALFRQHAANQFGPLDWLYETQLAASP